MAPQGGRSLRRRGPRQAPRAASWPTVRRSRCRFRRWPWRPRTGGPWRERCRRSGWRRGRARRRCSRSMAHHLVKAAALRLAEDTPGEGYGLGVDIASGEGFDGGVVGGGARIAHTTTILASRVLAVPSTCLPWRPSTSVLRAGTPVPSRPRSRVGASEGSGSMTRHSSPAILRPSASAWRSTILAATASPTSSRNKALEPSKLVLAVAMLIMRSAAGDRKVSAMPRARSRGLKPLRQRSQ